MNHLEQLLNHPSAARHIAGGAPPVPIHVRIEPTECCNMRCSFCIWHGRERHRHIADVTTYSGAHSLPQERLLALVDELSQIGTKAISFTGAGDPLMYPHMEEVLLRVLERGLRFAVTTNFAMPLTDSLLDLLSQAHWIRISVSASNAVTYNTIQLPAGEGQEGGRAFERLQDNVTRLIAARKKCGTGVRINASYVLTQENRYEALSAAQFAHRTGFDSISFRPDDPAICGTAPIAFDEQTQKQLYAAAIKFDSEHFRVSFSDAVLQRDDDSVQGLRCLYAHHTAYVAATGEVYPCCYTRYDRRFILGDISFGTFKDFWWSEHHQKRLKVLTVNSCPVCQYDATNIGLRTCSHQLSEQRFREGKAQECFI